MGPPGSPAPPQQGARSVGWLEAPSPSSQLQLELSAHPVAHRLGGWRSSHSLSVLLPREDTSLGRTRGQGLFLRGHDSGQVSDTASATWKQNRPLFSEMQKSEPPLGHSKLLSPRTRSPSCPRSVTVPAAPSGLQGPLNVSSGWHQGLWGSSGL